MTVSTTSYRVFSCIQRVHILQGCTSHKIVNAVLILLRNIYVHHMLIQKACTNKMTNEFRAGINRKQVYLFCLLRGIAKLLMWLTLVKIIRYAYPGQIDEFSGHPTFPQVYFLLLSLLSRLLTGEATIDHSK